jgi:hypothetical protein
LRRALESHRAYREVTLANAPVDGQGVILETMIK